MVSKGTSGDYRQSKQSEFSRQGSILRFVTDLDIVKVTISFCSKIARYAQYLGGEELNMNLIIVLGSKGTNEYSGQSKQSEVTRHMKTYDL